MLTLSRRPRLEPLEDRQTPAALAVRDPADFSPTHLQRGDDNSSDRVDLGFEIDFLGTARASVFVNTNGNLTFDANLSAFGPAPLGSFGVDLIAPFFADVDTRGGDSGDVVFGTGTVGGHEAFVATWDGVGSFERRDDRLDRFQVVIVDRSDRGKGDFDLELNYDRLEWDDADSTEGLGAWAGFADTDGTVYHLPGSGESGATLDSSATGLSRTRTGSGLDGRHVFVARGGTLAPNRAPTIDAGGDREVNEGATLTFAVTAADPEGGSVVYTLDRPVPGASIDQATGVFTLLAATPGDYALTVVATDEHGLSGRATFTVHVANVAPAVSAGDDVLLSAGDTLFRAASAVDVGPLSVTVDYGDGSGVQPVTLSADGRFALAHAYVREGTFTVVVTADDGSDATVATFSAIVLPDATRVTAVARAALVPGKTTSLDLTDAATGRKATVTVGRSAAAPADGSVLLAFYGGNPTGVPAAGAFFDVQIQNGDGGDAVTIVYDAGRPLPGATVRYFDGTRWRDVPGTLVRTATGFRLTVSDPTIFGGTVFAVGVTAGPTAVPGVVSPPQASAGGGNGTTDASSATRAAVLFMSRTQLTLTVTAVQDRQLTSGSAVGNQSGGNKVVTLSSTAGVGGNEEETEEADEEKKEKPRPAGEEKKDDGDEVKPATEERGGGVPPRNNPIKPAIEEARPKGEPEKKKEADEEAEATPWGWALAPLLALPRRVGAKRRRE